MSGLYLLPPKPDVCQECAVNHEPHLMHDNRSLYYQMQFYAKHNRWPTWDDAMSHCEPDIKEIQFSVLRDNRIIT